MFWLVWLFVFRKKGENAKEKMSWANVIRELKEIMTLGCWDTINGLNFLEQNLTTAGCRFLKKQTNKIKQTNNKNQTRTVKEKDASFSHSVAVLLTLMFNRFLKSICHPWLSEGFTVFYTISCCYRLRASTISPFYALLALQGLTISTATDGKGIFPHSTRCPPPTIIVVEEFHGQGDVVGKRAKVLH